MSPSDDAILAVNDLRLSIKGDEGVAKILDHIDFTLRRGRILGVVGESGCGKSTIIRAIIGILPPGARVEAGAILFDGEDLLGLGEHVLNTRIRGNRIGFIPQDPYLALNPVFKVGTQLMEIMRWHAPDDGLGRSGRDLRHRERILGLLRRVQLPEPEAALARYPHQFSGGQRQRLVIAAALATSPALVIADEPTTALDVTTQQQILDLLRDLTEEFGLSMLFVTHDLGVVVQLCDELCVIYAGQTVESGKTADVLAQPRHPYTKALLACHPDRAIAFNGIPGSVPSPLHPGAGCRFAPRCSEVREICQRRPPHLSADAAGRRVDCVLYDQPEVVGL
ncbi:MAG TPA: ABC transporter ATP-binding protein [Stellaceae bacterium]|jgi:peptide/nickel transport system ATP-binding protein|nr:ABC transporter ATP-binding protein [Stellaceae bacterium]